MIFLLLSLAFAEINFDNLTPHDRAQLCARLVSRVYPSDEPVIAVLEQLYPMAMSLSDGGWPLHAAHPEVRKFLRYLRETEPHPLFAALTENAAPFVTPEAPEFRERWERLPATLRTELAFTGRRLELVDGDVTEHPDFRVHRGRHDQALGGANRRWRGLAVVRRSVSGETIFHEIGHQVDDAAADLYGRRRSLERAFERAWYFTDWKEDDREWLGGSVSEAFAEGFARYMAHERRLAEDYPYLHAYFARRWP